MKSVIRERGEVGGWVEQVVGSCSMMARRKVMGWKVWGVVRGVNVRAVGGVESGMG